MLPVRAGVLREQLADLYFNLSSTYLGGLATKMVIVFLATSMLATGLAAWWTRHTLGAIVCGFVVYAGWRWLS